MFDHVSSTFPKNRFSGTIFRPKFDPALVRCCRSNSRSKSATLFQFVFIKFYKITETSGNTTSEPPEGKESQNSIVVNFGKNII